MVPPTREQIAEWPVDMQGTRRLAGIKLDTLPQGNPCLAPNRWGKTRDPHRNPSQMVRGNVPFFGFTAVPTQHANCACNEIHALCYRVLEAKPPHILSTNAHLQRQCRKMAAALLRKTGGARLEPWSLERVAAAAPKHKRKQYLAELTKMFLSGDFALNKFHLRLRAFVKMENANLEGKAEDGKPLVSRLIQYRHVRYNLHYGRVIKPIEKLFYGFRGPGKVPWHGREDLTWVFDGITAEKCAYLITEHMRLFTTPLVLSIDASKFDRHVAVVHLKATHKLYRLLCKMKGMEQVDRCIEAQLRSMGETVHGIKYLLNGNRASGDPDTALGNKVVVILVVMAVMERMGVERYTLGNRGDDCLIFMSYDEYTSRAFQYDFRAEFSRLAKEFGFKMTGGYACPPGTSPTDVPSPTRPEWVEFCRSRPVCGRRVSPNLAE